MLKAHEPRVRAANTLLKSLPINNNRIVTNLMGRNISVPARFVKDEAFRAQKSFLRQTVVSPNANFCYNCALLRGE
jgi:hypothetical protein